MHGLVSLAIVVAGLTIYGAGVIPGTAYFAALLLTAAWLYEHVAFRRRPLQDGMRYPSSAVPFGCILLIGYMLFTVIPIPVENPVPHSLRSFQDARAHVAAEKAVDLGLAEQSPVDRVSISRNRGGTLRTIILVICMMTAGGLAARMRYDHREQFLDGLIIFVGVVALLGFVSQWIIPQGKFLWWFHPIGEGRPVGCFINRNHFAGFVALMSPLAMARLSSAIAMWRLRDAFIYGAALAAISLAVVGSLSRGAFLAYLAGMMVCGLLLIKRHRISTSVAIVGCGGLILAGLVFLPSTTVLERLKTISHATETNSGQVRLQSWLDSLSMWGDYQWLGTGAEGFRSVFAAYRSSSYSKTFYYAENEYVQLLTDLGIVGVLLVVIVLLLWLWQTHSNRERIKLERHTISGIIGSLVVVFMHAGVDFPVRVPLYAIMVGILLGMFHARNASRQETRIAKNVETDGPPLWIGSAISASALALVVIVLLMFGRQIYRMDQNSFLIGASAPELLQALEWSPVQCQVWHALSLHGYEEGSREGYEFAAYCLEQGVRYNPNDYRVWRDLGMVRELLHDEPGSLEAAAHISRLRPIYQNRLGLGPEH